MEFQVIDGKEATPYKILIYGAPGIGKTSLAYQAPNALIIDAENGSSKLDVRRIHVENHNQLRQAAKWAAQQDFQTIVFDTMTAIEKMLTETVLSERGWKTLSDAPFGQGVVTLHNEWVKHLTTIDYLIQRGKNVIYIAHSRIKPFQSPNTENYDRYEPDVLGKSLPYITSVFDAVLFFHTKTIIKQMDMKDHKDIGAIAGARQLLTVDKVHAVAKNRFDLPDYLPVTNNKDASLFQKLH